MGCDKISFVNVGSTHKKLSNSWNGNQNSQIHYARKKASVLDDIEVETEDESHGENGNKNSNLDGNNNSNGNRNNKTRNSKQHLQVSLRFNV